MCSVWFCHPGIDKAADNSLSCTIRLYRNSTAPLAQIAIATISNFLNTVMPDDSSLFIIMGGKPGGGVFDRNFTGRIQYFRETDSDPGVSYDVIPIESRR